MVNAQPHNSPGNDPHGHPLKGASICGVERVTFEGLERGSPQYITALVSLSLMVNDQRVVVLDAPAIEAVRDLDIFEWSEPYPSDVRQQAFPYYPGDRGRHDQMAELERRYVQLKRSREEGLSFKGRFLAEPIHPNTPTSYEAALAAVEQEIDEIRDGMRRRCARGITVPDGRMRSTDFGELLIPLIHDKPDETKAQIFRIVLRAEDFAGKWGRRPLVEHISDLWDIAEKTQPTRALSLQSFNRHVRKLGVAILEGHLTLSRNELVSRAEKILAEGHVDTYLAGAVTRTQLHRHQAAYSWLQGLNQGQHGSVPYGSWHPNAKRECFDEAFKIITRARHHSYHAFGRLRMETRSLAGNLPLFREFAMECFEDVRFIRCDNGDLPPGRGTFMSGAILERLFHGTNSAGDVLHGYRNDENLWFADQLDNLEIASIVALRQWIGVTAPSDDFSLFNDRYYYVIDNDHFSGSYGFAFGIPASVVNAKLRHASYGIGLKADTAINASAARLSIPDLIEGCREAAKNHLVLGHMSPLFGGMCNALPVGSKPVFTYEGRQQGSSQRDVYGHVHWPMLVQSFRDDHARVDEVVKPLAKADHEIRHFATSGQKLFEAFRNRYAAWKNDLTPGEVGAPRLLARAYDIFRDHQERGPQGRGEETIYIGAVDRNRPDFDPISLLNCFTLELSSRKVTYKTSLPRGGDGRGKREQQAWRRHVAPFVEARTNEGELAEGAYELVLIGEKDIKRR
jgi:hypothetical protein